MTIRVAVTGMGVMTPFGFGVEAIRDNILCGRHRFGVTTRFDASRFRTAYSAQSEFAGSMLELGFRCTEEALDCAGLQDQMQNAALVIGISGDYNALNAYWKHQQIGRDPGSGIVEFLPAYHSDAIATRFRIGGPRLVFNNACVASSNAIGAAYDYIVQGKVDVAVCGGYSLVSEEMYAKFDSGMAFSSDGRVRSFSGKRTGMLLGDGGAMFVLEKWEAAIRRKATILAEIIGWGAACDAYHVCQPHPEGAGMAAAIGRALQRAELVQSRVDYINAHGTGTLHNDKSETLAIKRAFGDYAYDMPVSSTKTMTGHILEGTGAVETAICIAALQNNIVPPTAGYLDKDPHCDLDYVPNVPRSKDLSVVLNLNASFGGNNTALLVGKAIER